MKRILLPIAFIIAFAASAFAQSNPPLRVKEVDGSPNVLGVTTLVFSNGTVTCSGKTCTVVTGGGGGGAPGGASGTVQWNDGGSFNGTSGLTATATTVTIVSGVTATFSRAGLLYTGTVTTDNASVQTQIIQGDRATVTANDEAYVTYRLSNAAGTQTEVARQTWAIPTATAASENGRIDWSVMTGGALAKELQLAGDDLSPSTSDGLALGTASLQWSDLFLASGSVINFNNGDMAITHSANALTVSGGDLLLTSASTSANSVATIDGSQPLTNKTLTSSTNTLGSVTMDVTGTDADGDMYYRASGVLTRLGIGTAAQCLKVNAGATAPEWGACGGSGGIEVGVTAITSGTAGRLFYETAGNLFGEISGATSDGAAVTFTSGNLLATSPAFTTNQTTTNDAIGATSTDGIILQNTTAAAAGAQQYSPRIRLTGQGWKTTATAASQTVDWAIENRPSQGTTNPASHLTTLLQINGGGYTQIGGFSASGANQILFLGSPDSSGVALTKVGAGLRITDGAGSLGPALVTSSQLVLSNTAAIAFGASSDAIITRGGAAANIRFGANSDAASPVAQTLSFQGGTGTNTSGATATIRGSLGTSQGVPGRIHLQGGALIAASGTTAQTAVDRIISGATKVLTNNTAIDIVSAAVATETNAAGVIDYTVEITDGTDVQYEVGSVAYGVSNKGGVFSGNTATKFGNHQNATSGTLTVTFAISGANPALLSVNANSSLTPSTGYPRITYTLRNLTQQSVTIQ